MRTLAGTTASGVTAAVTQPGYLVEIGWSTPWRLSTRSTLTWDSKTWTAYDVQVTGLAASGASASCTLLLGNTDLAASYAVLTEGASGIAFKIWAFYGSAPGASDPVLVFEGIGDGASIPESGPVSISLVQSGAATLYCPRTYLTPDAGFNHLPTPGQLVTWEGETIRLDAEGI